MCSPNCLKEIEKVYRLYQRNLRHETTLGFGFSKEIYLKPFQACSQKKKKRHAKLQFCHKDLKEKEKCNLINCAASIIINYCMILFLGDYQNIEKEKEKEAIISRYMNRNARYRDLIQKAKSLDSFIQWSGGKPILISFLFSFAISNFFSWVRNIPHCSSKETVLTRSQTFNIKKKKKKSSYHILFRNFFVSISCTFRCNCDVVQCNWEKKIMVSLYVSNRQLFIICQQELQ